MDLKFNNINLDIPYKEITGIINDKNKVIKKILVDRLEIEGEVSFKDKVISYINKRDFLTKTVSDEFYLIKHNIKDSKDYIEKILLSLDMVGLSDEYLDKIIVNLSNSEKILIEIGLALITNPDIIIFDNVFKNLDRKNKLIIKKIILELKRKYNKTIIIMDDINILYEICNNFIIFKDNNLLISGNREDVFDLNIFIDNNIEIPFFIEFSNIAKEFNKDIKYYQDINDLLKGVYKNAR